MHKQRFSVSLRVGFAIVLAVVSFSGTASATQYSADLAKPAAQSGVTGLYRGVSTAVQFDISPALRSIPPQPVKLSAGVEIPDRPSGLEGTNGPQEADAAVQSELPTVPLIPSPLISFNGPSNISGVTPPDPVGDVGLAHYVAMSNLSFAVYTKTTGALAYGPAANNTLWAGFGGPCQTENAGDPIVLYDQLADRWMLTQFTGAGPTYFNCVALSTTSDPLGSYYRWAFTTGSNFPDYPKYGVWPDAYYIATREFAGGVTFAGVGAYALNRAEMLAGNPAPQVVSFLAPPGGTPYNVGDGLLPADIDGTALPPAGSPNYFMGSMDNGGPYSAPQDALTLWKFHVDWVTPANSTFSLADTIAVAAFDSMFPCTPSSRECIPQPTTSNKIDILSYRQRTLWRLAYRNFGTHESLVTNQSVEAAPNMAGIRWYEIRSPNSSPIIYQQSTYAPGISDGIHRWMGSIAMDSAGNMALGYSASAVTTTFPSVWYTGRLVTDPLNSLPQGEGSFVNGTGAQTGSQRWGDYTSMNVDPTDDCTFWYVNEYLLANGINWNLRIGSFKFPVCPLNGGTLTGVVSNTNTLAPITGALVQASSSPTLTVSSFSDGSGIYTMTLPEGTYTVTASATNYQSATVSGVAVVMSTTTTQDFSLTPLPSGDLSIAKAGAPNPVGVGGALTYTLSIANAGPDPVPSTVTVTDNLPASLGFGGVSGSGWTCGGTSTIVCTMPNLSVGAAPDIVITVTAPLTPMVLLNNASITSDFLDPNLANNATSLTTTVQALADLSITKTGPSVGTAGGTLVYTLSVANTGPSSTGDITTTVANATSITINDNSAGTPYPSIINMPEIGAIQNATVTLYGFTHTWPADVDALLVGPGGAKTLLMSDVTGGNDVSGLTLTFDDSGPAISCTSTVTLTSGTYHPTDCGGSSTDVFPAPAPAGPYSATLAALTGTGSGGAWSLYVRDDAAQDTGSFSGGWSLSLKTGLGTVTVTDTLPAGATFVGAAGTGWVCNETSGVVTCTNAGFTLGVAPDIVITATAPLVAGVITNTAVVGSAITDPDTSDNSASWQTTIGAPTYGVQLAPATQALTATAGSVVTYTLTVTNTGNVADTYTVTVSGNSFTTTAPSSVSLAAGASTTFEVVVTVGASGSDTATITLTSQGNGVANASATLTTTVALHKLYLPIIRR